MTFDKGVNYKLVLPAGSVSAEYRDDITNEEVIFNFVGAYTDSSMPFTYTWCSLFTDHSNILGEVSFMFDRPIEIAEDAKIQLWEIDPTEQLIMEVTPWLNNEVNSCCLTCDFGGYQREGEWGFAIVIPEGAIMSADNPNIKCARSEFRSESSGVENMMIDEVKSQTFYNLQGIIVDNPQSGGIYIHNGKKVVFK